MIQMYKMRLLMGINPAHFVSNALKHKNPIIQTERYMKVFLKFRKIYQIASDINLWSRSLAVCQQIGQG